MHEAAPAQIATGCTGLVFNTDYNIALETRELGKLERQKDLLRNVQVPMTANSVAAHSAGNSHFSLAFEAQGKLLQPLS